MNQPLKIKTSKATGLLLDYAIGIIKGLSLSISSNQIGYFDYSYTDADGISIYNIIPFSPSMDDNDFNNMNLSYHFENSIVKPSSIKEEVLRWIVQKEWGDEFYVPPELQTLA